MSLLATLLLAASASSATLPSCSWDRPGVNPFVGDVVAAVDDYADMPIATRRKIQARMQQRAYDEIAVIERERIVGAAHYAPEIRDMHFGKGTVCRQVSRSKWAPPHQERGLVYCEDGHCIIVPTVCRNVSRIHRLGPKPVAGAAQDETPRAEAEAPLVFDPPAAGETAPNSFAEVARVPTLQQLPGPSVPPLVTGDPPTLPPGERPPTLTPCCSPTPPLTPPIPTVNPPVPEPATWLMMGLGVAGLLWQRRRARD